MNTHEVRILHVTIDVPFATAYEFAHKPQNFPKWAAGLADSLHETNEGWIANTAVGQATVRFSEPNPFGVLDHWVSMQGRPQVYVPLRLIPNGDGTEVELVLLRQPSMTDADFARDTALVEKDLASLKTLLETGAVSAD